MLSVSMQFMIFRQKLNYNEKTRRYAAKHAKGKHGRIKNIVTIPNERITLCT